MRPLNKVAVFNDTSNNNHYGCDAVMETLNDWVGPHDSYGCGFTDNLPNEELQEILNKYELVIVNVEGSMHHDNNRCKGLSRIGRLHKGRSILLNATLYANSILTRRMIGKFDLVVPRQYGENYDFYTPDLTFYNNIEIEGCSGEVYVSDSNQKDVREELRLLALRRGFDYGRIRHAKGQGDWRGYVRRLGGKGMVVTGRFHDICFCINHFIPFIAVEGNTNKVEALLRECFGNTDRLIDKGDIQDVEYVPFFSGEEVDNIADCLQRGRQQLVLLRDIVEGEIWQTQ